MQMEEQNASSQKCGFCGARLDSHDPRVPLTIRVSPTPGLIHDLHRAKNLADHDAVETREKTTDG